MHVIRFEGYDPGIPKLPVQVQFFNVIRNGMRLRVVDDLNPGTVRPLVRLGMDPERLEAASELGALLESAVVQRGTEKVLNPEGIEWGMEDRTFALIGEIYETMRGTYFSLSDHETAQQIDAFLTPLPDGPTWKLTAAEYREHVAEFTP